MAGPPEVQWSTGRGGVAAAGSGCVQRIAQSGVYSSGDAKSCTTTRVHFLPLVSSVWGDAVRKSPLVHRRDSMVVHLSRHTERPLAGRWEGAEPRPLGPPLPGRRPRLPLYLFPVSPL